MKLQPASQKELTRIAVGSLICAAVLVAVFGVIGLLGLHPFSWTVVSGALVGTAVAVVNFALLCLTVQSAAEESDEKKMRAKVQLSYNGRLMFQAAWGLIALICPWFQTIAGILPLLFPRIVIYYLQITGKYKPQ